MTRATHFHRIQLRNGFTLVELMIAVAIVAILSAVALPAYTDYVTRGRIPEATSGLATRQTKAEQYFQDNRKYSDVSASNANPACVADTSGKYFDFACTTQSDTAYTIRASGKGSMASFTYTVDQSGSKATTGVASGWTTSATCWITNKGGVC